MNTAPAPQQPPPRWIVITSAGVAAASLSAILIMSSSLPVSYSTLQLRGTGLAATLDTMQPAELRRLMHITLIDDIFALGYGLFLATWFLRRAHFTAKAHSSAVRAFRHAATFGAAAAAFDIAENSALLRAAWNTQTHGSAVNELGVTTVVFGACKWASLAAAGVFGLVGWWRRSHPTQTDATSPPAG